MADIAAVTQIEITAKDSTQSGLDQVKGGLRGLSNATASLQSQWAQLTGILGAGAFALMVKSAIDAADKLNDLSKKTGIAVETLGGLSYAAAQSGTDIDAVAKGVAKLSNQMVDAASGGQKAIALFDAMGVSVKGMDGKLITADAALLQLADRFESYKDGPEKAALANQIFGDRLGAQMIPLLDEGGKKLREMVAEYERYGGITTDTAKRADQFNDTLEKLKLVQGAFFREIASGLLPVLQALAEVFVDVKGKGDGFKGVTEGITVAVKGLGIAAVGVVEIFKGVGASIGAVFAAMSQFLQGDVKGAWATLKEGYSDVVASASTAVERASKIWNASTATIAATTKTTFEQIRAPIVATSEAVKGVTSDFEKLEKQLLQEVGRTAELTRVEKLYAELIGKELTPAQLERLKGIAATIDALAEQKKRTDAAVKADIAGYEAMEKLNEEYAKMIKSAEGLVDSLNFEVEALTMTNAQREIAIKLRELERLGIVKGTEAYEQYAAKITSAVDRKEALEGQISLWKDIEGAAHDAFLHIFEGGKSVFDRLKDALKNGLLELLYQMTLKKWIIQISTAVTGGATAGMAGAAGIGGGGGGGAEGLSSLSSLASGAGNLLGMTTAGSAIGAEAAALVGNAALAMGAGTELALAAAANAIPIIGTVIAVAYLLYNVLSQAKGGPKSGGFAASGGVAGLNVDSDNSRYYTPNNADATLNTAVQSISKSYADAITALGGKAGTASFGLGYDQDPQGTAGNRVSAGASLNGVSVYDARNINAGSTDEELQAALSTEAQRSLLAALQNSELPANMVRLLNSVVASSATDAQISDLLKLANVYKSINDALKVLPDTVQNDLNRALDNTEATAQTVLKVAVALATLQKILNADPMEDALTAIADANITAYDSLQLYRENLEELSSTFDGSADAAVALADASAAYYNAQVMLLAQIKQVGDAVHGMFQSTIEAFKISIMSPQEQYNYLQKDADRLRDLLLAEKDPAKINQYAQQINDDLNKAFGLLSDDEKRANINRFIDNINRLDESVATALSGISTETQNFGAQLFVDINTVLQEVAKKLGEAGDKINQGADKIASTEVDVNISVSDDRISTTSEVYAGDNSGGG